MDDDDVTGVTGSVSAGAGAGLMGRRTDAAAERPGRSRARRGWLAVCSGVLAAAALAACDPGHATGSSGAPDPAPITPSIIHGDTTACVTSAAKGSCGPYHYPAITQSDGQNTFIGQDTWNPITGWSQTLHATNPGRWYVTANMPAGNTAVVSYPNVGQQYYYTNTLADFSSIRSSFTEDMHPSKGTSAWAAYDIWLNDWKNEVMIQHDFAGNAPCPAAATATFGGSGGVRAQKWELCTFGSELIWKLRGGNEQSGTVDIKAMLTWLVSHKYLQQKSGLTDISYGWEICSTAGRPEKFTLSRFSIHAPSAKGPASS